jgi:hypothetical protein
VSASAKLAGFAGILVVVFGAAAVAGGAVGPEPATESEDHGMTPTAHSAPTPVRGLAVAEHGIRVVVEDPELRRGRTEEIRFRIVDERGATVRHFDVEHEKRMHLIVVRRDLTGFQHLHPEQDEHGTWTTNVRLDAAGSYRLLADFARAGESYTLASDLRVDGPADLTALPEPTPEATSDGGYDVRLDSGTVRAGEPAELRFAITRGGEPVRVQPYLGAGGHLVALREGDLAFLHVHPADDAVAFEATFPTEGSYRLFLQFRHAGRVQTVAFTQEVTR